MKSLVETIAKSLVDNPDEVSVREITDGGSEIIELRVAASDMGKIIGKQGRIVKAIRTVVKSAGAKQNRKIEVEVVS
ncbi:MAG: KH domain-containing protein [Clostridiales bacterium]|nr:KH domain-containing protein [Clostridiales bacterium]